jgi:aminoglycoside 3-N-acetyltransferase I
MVEIRRLDATDAALMRRVNAMFGAAFEDPEAYEGAPPADAYLERVLGQAHVIALAALDGEIVVGGLVAYELDKLEQARREVYLYDLAVAEAHRRRGVATALIARLRAFAAERGAWVVYVQPTTATSRRSRSTPG